METEKIKELAHTVSRESDLRLPPRLANTACSVEDKEAYISALLRHDPGVFLERHGALLEPRQREYFGPLRNEYEVDFYIKFLEDQDTSSEKKEVLGLTSKIKNRRLAKMNRLLKDGYFEEEASRRRAPLLHYNYIGQYKVVKADSRQATTSCQPSPKSARAATLHDKIIAQHDELELQTAMAQQQRQEDAAGAAFEATLSESEDEEQNEGQNTVQNGAGCRPECLEVARPTSPENKVPSISNEELEQNKETFDRLMQLRFLSGEDGGAEADEDESLDDDWAKEINQDLEDKYFSDS